MFFLLFKCSIPYSGWFFKYVSLQYRKRGVSFPEDQLNEEGDNHMETELTALEKAKRLMRKFEHPKAGTWERVELDIKRNRMGWCTVFLKDASGAPLKNCEIKIRQKSHDFKFGCNAFKLKNFAEQEKNDAYEEYFKRVFNEAVVPFLWDSTEPEQGKFRFIVHGMG